jgi:hypothetical protein
VVEVVVVDIKEQVKQVLLPAHLVEVVVEMVHLLDHLLDLEEIQEELVVQDLHMVVLGEAVVLVVLE